jgi:hypothetical protein
MGNDGILGDFDPGSGSEYFTEYKALCRNMSRRARAKIGLRINESIAMGKTRAPGTKFGPVA